MKTINEKIPDPKEIERELGEFLAKKFGGEVKIVSPIELPQKMKQDPGRSVPEDARTLHFDMKPRDLIAHLDQYIVRQNDAKAILATKICTHFNRINRAHSLSTDAEELVGSIKNNVLLMGPTGVGKTYMIKLIAKKIGVPFVKGDATKFSETGYVGGDVEDLVRDLVREAGGNVDLAENGIIYIDEVDKIASNRNIIGADVSRTGVQRALLKPMEETEVELKVPHDPISMIQEIERFRKTGKRDNQTVNTRNILFIMSGAFSDLTDIIRKRLTHQPMGFGARFLQPENETDLLKNVTTGDLIQYGFESEFVGRLPIMAVMEHLKEADLFEILQNPNNPVILGKKLDFDAYGIDVKFEKKALRKIATIAAKENTGARGLVSAVEKALIVFEKTLPSTKLISFPVTEQVIETPEKHLEEMLIPENREKTIASFQQITDEEKAFIKAYLQENRHLFSEKHGMTLSAPQIETIAEYYVSHIMDVGTAVGNIKSFSDEIKKIELYFYKNHDINIVLEDDAIHHIIHKIANTDAVFDDIYKQLETDFELGLKLVRDKTGRNRFFLTKDALNNPESYISNLIKGEFHETLQEQATNK